MRVRIEQRPPVADDASGVAHAVREFLPPGIARAAVEDAAHQAFDGRGSVATVRDLLHRYRDEGRLSAAACDRVISVLEARVSEDANTIPGIASTNESDDPFTKTTVLPQDEAVGGGDSDRQLQVGSVLRDRFLLQERVAGGSMGVVYKALDRRLAEVDGVEPWVAIKVLSPELAGNAHALRALQQEAAKGRCLTHPNIVRFIDFDREDDLYFIIMEWLEGRSLAAVLDAGELTPGLPRSFEIVREIGEALSYAHRCGVIHADVKPANVMVLPSGTIKLFDFGIARVRQQQRVGGGAFDPGVLGAVTPAYSSMQVLTGEEPSVADDVFSLACLAYRLFAGHRVFGPRNAAEAAEGGMEPQRPPGLADPQWKALRKALSHSRVARFASTGEFLDALLAPRRSAQRDAPLAVVADEAIVERRFEERPRRWPYAVLVLLAAVVGAVFLLPERVADVVSTAEGWLGRQQAESPAAPDETEPAASAGIGDTEADADADATGSATDAAPAPAADVAGDTTPTEPSPASPDPDVATANDARSTETPAASAAATGEPPETAAADEVQPSRGGDAATDDDATAAAEDSGAPENGVQPEPGVPPRADTASAAGTGGLVLAAPGEERPELDLTLREGGETVNVSVYRWFGLTQPLTVRIDEVGYSGNRSPRDSGQYTLSDGGVLSFDRGQRSVELQMRMPEDSEREADQQVSLLLRDYYDANAELGVVNLSLLDDDQRAFEAEHAANTIAFAQGQVIVPERHPAVQVDVLRLNPDRRTLTVRYRVEDGSATDGEDYFSPGRQSVTFGPGQRTARLLIPLVQDSLREGDESFTIELDEPAGDSNTFRRIAVIIRDDD